MKYLLNTNAVLYFLHERLDQPLPCGNYYFSIITEIERLSYPSITEKEANNIRQLLAVMTRVN